MDEKEVTVRFEPLREIVVMQETKFASPDDLARFALVLSGGKTTGLYWAEGVVFLYFLLPASTETAAKALVEDGRVYWTLVSHAMMEKYQSIIETKEKIMVPVIDMSSNPMMAKVANRLKLQEV